MSASGLPASGDNGEAAARRRWGAVAGVGLLLVLGLAVYPAITASFWLDETGTFWIAKDGFRDMVHRANWWSATSPAYYTVAWASAQPFGLNEIALRAPSVIFSMITAVLLFYLARRWLDAEHSVYAVLIFFCIESVNFSVVDARPYAFGLMLLVTAWLAFYRWAEAPGFGRAVVFSLSAAGVVYAHYLLALGLLPLGLYVICPILPTGRVSLRRFAVVMFITAALLIPLGPQIRTVFGQRSALSWAEAARWSDLEQSLIRPAMLLFVAAGWLLAFGEGGRPWREVWEQRLTLLPLVAWSIIPPVALFCLSICDWIQLFFPRYYISKEPATAILVACLLGPVHNQRLARTILILVVICSSALNLLSNYDHRGQDWRGGVASVNHAFEERAELRVVVVSGFVESLRDDYWADPATRDILFAPLLAYPLAREPFQLPLAPGPLAETEFSHTIAPALPGTGELAVLCPANCGRYRTWLTERTRPLGLLPSGQSSFGVVTLLRFRRQVRSGGPRGIDGGN